MIRQCEYCHNGFVTRKKRVRFCSPQCGYKNRSTIFTKECEFCHVEFVCHEEDRMFCSLVSLCRHAAGLSEIPQGEALPPHVQQK